MILVLGNGAYLMPIMLKVGMYDLASDNMLRFACQKFPDSTFFYELLMTREPQK